MFWYREQTAGQNESVQTADRSFDNAVYLIHLQLKRTNQNYIQK